MRRFHISAGLLMFASVAHASPALAQSCPNGVRDRAQNTAATGDLAGMKVAFADVERCGDTKLAQWLGQRIASAIYNKATASAQPDEALLTSALKYGRPWQVLATLGDLVFDRRDYAAATRRYQEALTEIESTDSTPVAPPPAVILGIRKKAEQAGLLSATYVPAARTRDNKNSGLGALSIRGVSVPAVALPVEFEFGKTDFTPKGAAAMRDMIDLINNQSPAPGALVIEGHTDPIGSDAENLLLSKARAQVVANALRTGLSPDRRSVRITVIGRGVAMPYRPDDPTRYDEAQLYQMHRRVELKRQ